MRINCKLTLVVLISVALLVSSCGEDTGSNPQLPTLMLNVDSVTVDVSSTFQFTATLDGDATSVSWYVGGTAGGDPLHGMITTAGLYIAPGEPLPIGSHVSVTARATEDTTLTASAIVTIQENDVYLLIQPPMATVALGDSVEFVCYAYGCSADEIVWSVEKIWGSGAVTGYIRSNGTYVAPSLVDSSLALLVTATSPTCPNRIGIARVNLPGLPRPFDVELEDFTDSLSLNGVIRRLSCGAASGGMAVWGLDATSEYVEVPMKVPATGQYVASVWYSANAGDTIRVSVAVVDCGAEQTEEFVLDEGTGTG